MITRFLQIQVQLSSIVDLLALLLTHSELEFLKRAHASLKKFNAVTIMLQKEGMSFLEVRELFQEVLEDFPDFKHYLADEANIVEDPLFGEGNCSNQQRLTAERRAETGCCSVAEV
jgi:hypothetical protein